MPCVSTTSGELFYEVCGSGPPVILVAGLGGLGNFWRLQTSALARRFTVLTYDHRGSGQSSKSPPPYTVTGMAKDLLTLMDHLRLDAAHFVGHSLGGAICQCFAVSNPERIRRLVLSATWTHCDAYIRRLFSLRRDILRSGDTDTYARLATLLLYSPDWISDHDKELLEGEGQLPEDVDPVILAGKIDALLAFDSRRTLFRITSPTLVVAARDDVTIPIHFSHAFAKALPNVRIQILESGGHYCPITRAQLYNTILSKFLGQP